MEQVSLTIVHQQTQCEKTQIEVMSTMLPLIEREDLRLLWRT